MSTNLQKSATQIQVFIAGVCLKATALNHLFEDELSDDTVAIKKIEPSSQCVKHKLISCMSFLYSYFCINHIRRNSCLNKMAIFLIFTALVIPGLWVFLNGILNQTDLENRVEIRPNSALKFLPILVQGVPSTTSPLLSERCVS